MSFLSSKKPEGQSQKAPKPASAPDQKLSKPASAAESNWYVDKYQQVIVQRNLLFIIAALCLLFISVAVVVAGAVISSKHIEPLVVEVDELSGITTLVNPTDGPPWKMDTAISTYFLMTYLRARETYNVCSYTYNFNTVVRLMSSGSVWRPFNAEINNPNTSPITQYGSQNNTTLEIRSILNLPSTTGAYNTQVRFSVVEQSGARRQFNKIASIIWDFVQMNLNADEKAVNPLGFQVQSYTVANDVNVLVP